MDALDGMCGVISSHRMLRRTPVRARDPVRVPAAGQRAETRARRQRPRGRRAPHLPQMERTNATAALGQVLCLPGILAKLASCSQGLGLREGEHVCVSTGSTPFSRSSLPFSLYPAPFGDATKKIRCILAICVIQLPP